jgi:serine phosphatase RsbU (regulator of sigma subunit)
MRNGGRVLSGRPAQARCNYIPAGKSFWVRLPDVVASYTSKPPEQIIKALYGAVLAFSHGTKQEDDLTGILIKRV